MTVSAGARAQNQAGKREGIYSHAPRASIETLNHVDTLARCRDMLRAPSSLYREDGARYGILWYQVNILYSLHMISNNYEKDLEALASI